MTAFSRVLGNLLHAEKAVRTGLERAALSEGTLEHVMGKFFGEHGKAELEAAAFRFGIEEQKRRGSLIEAFDLGSYWFLVKRYYEFEVDFDLSIEEIEKRAGIEGRRYAADLPVPGRRRVKAAIGHFDRDWRASDVYPALNMSDCPLRGSGAWVREAFRSNFLYDGTGTMIINFIDPATSCWEEPDQHFTFPILIAPVDKKFLPASDFSYVWQKAHMSVCLLVP